MAPASTSRSARLPSTDGATRQSPGEGRAPEVLHDADGFVMATWKNIAIHVWTVQATPALVDTLDRLTASFIGAPPEGISAVHTVAKNAPLPDADVRERLQLAPPHGQETKVVVGVAELEEVLRSVRRLAD